LRIDPGALQQLKRNLLRLVLRRKVPAVLRNRGVRRRQSAFAGTHTVPLETTPASGDWR